MAEELILAEISAEVLNTNFSKIEDAVNAKAELNGDSTQKFSVADAVELTEAINKRQLSNTVATINADIAAKADKSYVDVNLILKANTSDVEASLATKADMSYVDTNLALKANTADVDAALVTKLDASDITVTKQGNTFNGAGQLVKLNSNGQLPAVDGSLLTGISGNLSPLVENGTVTSNFTLDLNKINMANITVPITVSFPASGFVSGVENICTLDFTTTSTSSPILPTGLKWSDKNAGKAPSCYSTLTGVRNVLTFITRDGGTTWEVKYETYGGVETTFVQPALSTNGALGGSSFAVYSSSVVYDAAYCGADNNPSTSLTAVGSSFSAFYHTWYNPISLKVSSITFLNKGVNGQTITSYTLYGSDDNYNWTIITNGTNAVTGASATWDAPIPEASKGFYKYYKIYASAGGYYCGWVQATLNAVYVAT